MDIIAVLLLIAITLHGYCSYVEHYSKSKKLISFVPSAGYNWGAAGCEIYLKKVNL